MVDTLRVETEPTAIAPCKGVAIPNNGHVGRQT